MAPTPPCGQVCLRPCGVASQVFEDVAASGQCTGSHTPALQVRPASSPPSRGPGLIEDGEDDKDLERCRRAGLGEGKVGDRSRSYQKNEGTGRVGELRDRRVGGDFLPPNGDRNVPAP